MTVMHMTKNVGKPYEGKLHVRFDEGELKVKQRPAKESLLEISSLLYACPASRKLLTGESPVRVSAKALGSYQTTGEEILRLKLCDKVPTKVGQASHQVVT